MDVRTADPHRVDGDLDFARPWLLRQVDFTQGKRALAFEDERTDHCHRSNPSGHMPLRAENISRISGMKHTRVTGMSLRKISAPRSKEDEVVTWSLKEVWNRH
jgi:hypothetical protein